MTNPERRKLCIPFSHIEILNEGKLKYSLMISINKSTSNFCHDVLSYFTWNQTCNELVGFLLPSADLLVAYCSYIIGYLEDRRPASNMDPYVVTSLLAETALLYEPTLEAEALAAQKVALKV